MKALLYCKSVFSDKVCFLWDYFCLMFNALFGMISVFLGYFFFKTPPEGPFWQLVAYVVIEVVIPIFSVVLLMGISSFS